MKKLKRNLIKAALLCLSIALGILLSQLSYGQSQPIPMVQAMVKNQPFPYPCGVAMDTTLYVKVRARLLAADSLRSASERAIRALQAEIVATRKVIDDQFRLNQYDEAKAKTLLAQLNSLQGQLIQAQTTLREASLARDAIVKELPRKVRNQLQQATPDQIAAATVTYIHVLQNRKWKWAGWAAGSGVFLGFIAHLF
ncbi:hypothetical protein G8759_20050 [Spirosoma aureum]|uniref:Uncharacterized protein n=1 Tax=Spirosoma aureum TaxID=2692134 RepID=A0A6G9AR40_9BACT|nr:hypothetical protein [Spirosoma aureum]QIP14745.1 hypothetical protein G8759_20050 [Spirosoma aureum]